MARINIDGKSDMGRKRTNNEDAYIATRIWGNRFPLAVAIDGVGGYEGGEVAAQIARDGIVEYLENNRQENIGEALRMAVIHVNNLIYEQRQQDKERPNMSCVLTAALFDTNNSAVYMAHVGDTRLYMYCNGQLDKLSHDHSLVGYREEIGDLTEIEAMNHPQRNIINRSVGHEFMPTTTDLVEAASYMIPRTNCAFLLCSDGLTDLVTSQQIITVLEGNHTIAKQLNLLIDAANNAGGKDNITVVIVNFTNQEAFSDGNYEPVEQTETAGTSSTTQGASGKKKTQQPQQRKGNKLALPLFIAIVALLASIAGNWFTLSSNKEKDKRINLLEQRYEFKNKECAQQLSQIKKVAEIVAQAGDKDTIASQIKESIFNRHPAPSAPKTADNAKPDSITSSTP